MINRKKSIFIILSLLLLVTLSCTVGYDKKNNRKFIGIQALEYIWLANDNIKTSKEYSEDRYRFTPSKKIEKFFKKNIHITRLENNYFLASTDFDINNIKIQEGETDCWAASSLMLMLHEKIIKNNNEFLIIKNKYFNEHKDKGELDIYSNLLNSYKNITYARPITTDMFFNSIGNNHPVLVGFKYENSDIGHICLITSCFYYYSDRGIFDKFSFNIIIDKIIYIDPSTGKKVEASGDFFKNNAAFAISFLPINEMATFEKI